MVRTVKYNLTKMKGRAERDELEGSPKLTPGYSLFSKGDNKKSDSSCVISILILFIGLLKM